MGLQWNSLEYNVLSDLFVQLHRTPSKREYRERVRDTYFPSAEMLVKQYGSFQEVLSSFTEAYFSQHGYPEIPDYLLGALISRTKLVQERRGQTYLRFISEDKEQIKIIRSFLYNTSEYHQRKDKATMYVRCYDKPMIATWQHLNLNEVTESVFRPTVDFVRGYIDTHSCFRKTTTDRRRLTLSGPLVPQCHDFLVQLGASNTTVQKLHNSYRMNIHSRSLARIRDALYPNGCVCNEHIRMSMYQA